MKTITLKITGMKCDGCVKTAKEALSKVKGVSSVEIDLKTGKAIIKTDDSVISSTLADTINKNTGYKATDKT